MIGNEHVKLHPKCSWLPFETNSWITKLAGGSLLAFEAEKTVDANGVEGAVPYVSVSSDGGQSWEKSQPLNFAPGTAPCWLAEVRIIIQTPSGALVAFYEDIVSIKWDWDAETNTAGESTKLDVWSCRSEDGGKTWQDCLMVVEGWCGALIDIKLLSDGRIAATAMNLLYKEGRHTCFTLVSEDDGKTWKKGNIIDLGGSGDHDGAMEPTFVELADGSYYMLIRTNLDYFWEAYSDDCLNWRTLRKSNIDASSSPGHLLRLASGRIALVWSRLKMQGQSEVERYHVPRLTSRPVSWQRRELSIAFSDDECKSWSEPVVIARNELDIDAEQQLCLGQISYPYLLEYEPGDLWVIARAPTGGPINFRLNEADF